MSRRLSKNKNSTKNNVIKHSIFDDGKTPLWETLIDSSDFEKEFIIREVFQRKSKNNKIKMNSYSLNDDCLFYEKMNKNNKCQRRLSFAQTKIYFDEEIASYDENQNSKKMIFTIKFTKNNSSFEIFTQDFHIFNSWKEFLRYKCIMSTYHEDFDTKKIIGKGSFAKVYLANKKENHQEFAIKTFAKESITNQNKGIESLTNEISIMRKLNHPHIIKLYEIYETLNSVYLVMDVIKGGELMKKIKEKTQYTFLDIQKFLRNFLDALFHIHKQNIMHRDLKPENLLLKNENFIFDIVIADFGLSSFVNINLDDMLFKRCGTPGFVGPEILNFKDGDTELYNEKCDIFSAGVIFYILLTGKKPFAGSDYKDVLRANRNCDVDFQKEIFKILPKNTMDLLKKMMASEPLQRISAEEALKHPFFDNLKKFDVQAKSPSIYKQTQEELDYMQKVKANLLEYNSFHITSSQNHDDKEKSSSKAGQKDSIDNIKLTNRSPLLRGQIETLERVSLSSNLSISNNSIRNHPSSKLSIDSQNKTMMRCESHESPSHFSGKRKNCSECGRNEEEKENLMDQSLNPKNVSYSSDDSDDIPEEDPILTKIWPDLKEFQKKYIEFDS